MNIAPIVATLPQRSTLADLAERSPITAAALTQGTDTNDFSTASSPFIAFDSSAVARETYKDGLNTSGALPVRLTLTRSAPSGPSTSPALPDVSGLDTSKRARTSTDTPIFAAFNLIMPSPLVRRTCRPAISTATIRDPDSLSLANTILDTVNSSRPRPPPETPLSSRSPSIDTMDNFMKIRLRQYQAEAVHMGPSDHPICNTSSLRYQENSRGAYIAARLASKKRPVSMTAITNVAQFADR
ncbi:hypothetical protein GCK32_002979 [Trichostrongylus colubriformis]|uniref:Uncharacterized protein n=1 Tax=Trichostrongylus colubriformis TaxID=6319 RepID=A0AAN8IFZ4_TRICO